MTQRVAALLRFGWQPSDGIGGRLRRFTQYAQKHLDPEIKRGRDAKETGAKHMRPEAYGKLQDDIKANKKRAAKLAKDQAAVEALQRQARETIETSNRAAAQVACDKAALFQERTKFEAQREVVLRELGKRVLDALALGNRLALAAYQALQRLAGVAEDALNAITTSSKFGSGAHSRPGSQYWTLWPLVSCRGQP